ncbi:MAG: hypothetical protein ACRCTK_01435 [Alphaproteobacteria bacterium]
MLKQPLPIPFDGAGKTTIQKLVSLFQELPQAFNLSVESLTASTNAVAQF